MKPEFQKIFSLFEELEVAGETVSLTILSKEGKSTIKLQLESPPSPSSSTTTPSTSAAHNVLIQPAGPNGIKNFNPGIFRDGILQNPGIPGFFETGLA